MIELGAVFSYALVLGLFHAFEGDHIAAVSAMTTESKKRALLGLFWGIGHTFVLLVVGLYI